VAVNSDESISLLRSINAPESTLLVRYSGGWVSALVVSDLAMFTLAAYVADGLIDHRWDIHGAMASFLHSSVIFVVVWMVMFYTLGLYRRSLALSFRDEFYFTVVALVVGVLPQLVVFTMLPQLSTSRAILLLAAGIAIVLVGTTRSLVHVIWKRRARARESSVGSFESTSLSDVKTSESVKPNICMPSSVISKRLCDLVFASIALLLCLPVMLATSLLIFVESGNPVFFRQERVGRFGRIFRIIKFRTMIPNAGSAWAKPGDARITRIGSLLRRTSIDELPQLLNVLAGDMSLVGPRPEMIDFEQSFAASVSLYARRRLALPGITGWAQVNMQRNLSPDDVKKVLSYDLFYIEHWSLFLDFTVMLKTTTEVVFHKAV